MCLCLQPLQNPLQNLKFGTILGKLLRINLSLGVAPLSYSTRWNFYFFFNCKTRIINVFASKNWLKSGEPPKPLILSNKMHRCNEKIMLSRRQNPCLLSSAPFCQWSTLLIADLVQTRAQADTGWRKVPSPHEPLREPSAVPSCEPSCEEKGSSKGSCEGSDESTFHVKVHVKVFMKVQMKVPFM